MRAMSGFFFLLVLFTSKFSFNITSWKEPIFLDLNIRGLENKLRIFIHMWWRCAIKDIHNVSLFLIETFVKNEKHMLFLAYKRHFNPFIDRNYFFCVCSSRLLQVTCLRAEWKPFSTPCCDSLWIFHS